MNTTIDDDLLIRFLTENVSLEEKMQVEHWCTLSDGNQKVLEQLYLALYAGNCLKLIRSVDADSALLRLKKNIHQQNKALQRRLLVHRLQRVAAVLFLPALLLSVWLLIQNDETLSVQYVEVLSNSGMVSSFNLPDGSMVWLNGGSRLRYPTTFSGNNREVQMSGQGYFEVKHNSEKPFLVKISEEFSLEVLGTSFNLSAYDDEDMIETTLVNGSVQLNLMQNDRIIQRVMSPNEKMAYSKEAQTLRASIVDPIYDVSWKDRRLLFKDHSMEQVIRTLGRYYNVRFRIKNAEVMNSEITGEFSNEPLPQVMEYLKIASGIRYNILPDAVENGEIKPGIVEIWK